MENRKKIVIIARSFPLCRDSASYVYAAGMYPIVIPMMSVERVHAINYAAIAKYDNIIMTSRNAVRILHDDLKANDMGVLNAKAIYVVGKNVKADCGRLLKKEAHCFETAEEMRAFLVEHCDPGESYVHLAGDRLSFDIYSLRDEGYCDLSRVEIYKMRYVQSDEMHRYILLQYLDLHDDMSVAAESGDERSFCEVTVRRAGDGMHSDERNIKATESERVDTKPESNDVIERGDCSGENLCIKRDWDFSRKCDEAAKTTEDGAEGSNARCVNKAGRLNFMIYSSEAAKVYGKMLSLYDIDESNFVHISEKVYNAFKEQNEGGRHIIAFKPNEKSMIEALTI